MCNNDGTAMITVKNLTKKYGLQTVLDNISFTCTHCKIYGLIGRNGSGKTVLMKSILGLIKPDCGEVIIHGRRVGKDIDFPDNIGFIVDTPGFLPHESAMNNLKYLASIRRRIDNERIRECIKLVGLDPYSRKTVGKYSMGMQQRLGIAQAIMEDPEVLMLDEPMNGLDNTGVSEVHEMLMTLRDKGKTIILASHNREDIELLCDHVFEMDAGKLNICS